MNIPNRLTGFFRKSTTSTNENEPENIGKIRDTYYYRWVGNEDLMVSWGENDFEIPKESESVVVLKGTQWKDFKINDSTGTELIQQLVRDHKIIFQPLGIEAYTDYTISNRTAQTQKIEPYKSMKGMKNIEIHAFGTHSINSQDLRFYDFIELQRRGLIQVERQDQTSEIQNRSRIKSFMGWGKQLITQGSYITNTIKDNYYYQLYNKTEEELELKFPSANGSKKIPYRLPNSKEPDNIQVFKGISLKSVGKQKIQNMYDNYLINLVPLGLEVNTNYKISNLTAKEITIESRDIVKHPNITLPPFGETFRNSDILKWYNFLDFQDQERIQIERKDQIYKIQDWIKLTPFIGWFRQKIARDSDVIGTIRDDYYYRLHNKSDEFEIELPLPPSKDGSLNKSYHLPKYSNRLRTRIFSGITLNTIGKKKFQDLVSSNLVNFQPLDIKVDTNYILQNRTEQRIGIMNYNKMDQLVLPPLGTRLINSDKLRWYDFLDWYWQDLIRIEPEDRSFFSSARITRIWDFIKILPGITLVGLAGIGIPIWITYNFGGGSDLLRNYVNGQRTIEMLGRIFQVGFICIASILPALFYYLFGRQQVKKLRERFFRDVLVLDPHLFSLSEAESKYDTLLDSAFGSGSSATPLSVLLLIFSTALLVTGWTLTLAPYGSPSDVVPDAAEKITSIIPFFVIKSNLLTLGFLGVYFFSINMIFRRYVRADLTPKTYASIIVRLLVSLVLVFTIGVLGSSTAPSFLAAAFIIGVFPEDGFRFIRDTARKIVPSLKGGVDERYPLTDLEGMNQYDQARLLEEGIENIENLAHHNLIELLAFTRIPTARLVDMFDQAILHIHLGVFDHDKAEGERPKLDNKQSLKFLNNLGVRTATDLMEILKDENIEQTKTLLNELKEPFSLSRLQTIETTFKDDEWLSFIINWRKESAKQSSLEVTLVTDPSEFYHSDATISKKLEGAVDLPILEIEVNQD